MVHETELAERDGVLIKVHEVQFMCMLHEPFGVASASSGQLQAASEVKT